MFVKSVLLSFLNAGPLAEAGVIRPRQSNGGSDSTLCLQQDALQSASASTGQDPNNPTAGQANSATDEANFINFCSGKTLTNGLQVREGSCNGVVMGEIPSTANMVSCNILAPQHNDDIPAFQDFDISVKVANLQAGAFTNPQLTYYSAPQQLNDQGNIIGHVHVTVQDLGNSLNPTKALDPTLFAFFKGINNAGDGNGLLKATVPGGLPAGNYRVCTMTSSSNHQPVLMPVAQRGSQEDCQKFVVSDNASAGNGRGNSGGNDVQNQDVSTSGTAMAESTASDDGAATQTENTATDTSTEETATKATGASSTAAKETATEDAGASSTEGAEASPTEDAEATESNVAGTTSIQGAKVTRTDNTEATQTDDAKTPAATDDGGVTPGDAVGGITPPPVEIDNSDRRQPFKVGGSRFGDRRSAVRQACREQNNSCCSAARSRRRGVSVQRCNKQISRCVSQLSRGR